MSEYPLKPLGVLAADEPGAIAIGPFGSRMKADVYVPQGVPVVRGMNIGRDRALSGDWVFVTDEFADGIANCVVKPGDLVFPHRGSIGEVALIEDHHGRMVLSTSMMKFRPDPRKALSEFLYYYFRSAAGRSEILRFGSQVGTPGIGQPLTSMRQFRVPIPSLSAQAAIAEILGSLDNKIELNRRMNETLEAMAQAIFRDWFVDFGPTRRKSEGATDPVTIMGGLVTDPDRARELAVLFPGRLGDDGLPEGWEEGTLGDIARAVGTTVLPSEIAADTPYIGLEHMPRRSIALEEWEAASKVSSNKSAFRRGQILFGKLRPYFHKVGIAPVDGVCSTDIIVLDAINGHTRSMIAACVSTDEFVGFTDQGSTGTKMPRTSWGNMKSYAITLPPDGAIERYAAIASPLMEKIVANVHENRMLAATRDLLLPKLMSGEIRLRETTTELEAAQ